MEIQNQPRKNLMKLVDEILGTIMCFVAYRCLDMAVLCLELGTFISATINYKLGYWIHCSSSFWIAIGDWIIYGNKE